MLSETKIFFGTFLLVEFKYSPVLSKYLQLFTWSDTLLTPIERFFGYAITELTSSLFNKR
jgi:hypothetical protein